MQETTQLTYPPTTVVGAKEVKLALVSYTDGDGNLQSQLAVVGDNTVHLLNSKELGLANATSAGPAATWLKNGVFKKLGIK